MLVYRWEFSQSSKPVHGCTGELIPAEVPITGPPVRGERKEASPVDSAGAQPMIKRARTRGTDWPRVPSGKCIFTRTGASAHAMLPPVAPVAADLEIRFFAFISLFSVFDRRFDASASTVRLGRNARMPRGKLTANAFALGCPFL